MKTYNIIVLLAISDSSGPVRKMRKWFCSNRLLCTQCTQYASGIYDLKNTETIEFTTSQPDYGFTAVAIYSVEVSLSQDFSEAVTLPGTYTTAKFNMNAADLALALVGLHGVTEESAYPTDPHPLYVRLSSVLNAKNEGAVKSNIITLPKVKGYFALDPMVIPRTCISLQCCRNWSWDGATKMVPVWGTPVNSGPCSISARQEVVRMHKLNSISQKRGMATSSVSRIPPSTEVVQPIPQHPMQGAISASETRVGTSW